MKCTLLSLPLVGLAPLGYFLGFYLDGAGVLRGGVGFLLGVASMFILPWLVSAVFALFVRTTWSIRILLFVCTLIVQAVCLRLSLLELLQR